MPQDEILIVGAGPTGMVLAMVLRLHNVPFRIITAASGPGTLSRAMGVHARTLELYRPFNLSQRAVDEGIHTNDAVIRVPDSKGVPKPRARMPFNEMGTGVSKYPFILQYAQDYHEHMLADKLNELGVKVEWDTKLESLQQMAHGASVLISGPHGEEKQTFRFVVGADGAHSKVRHCIDVGFPGGTYEQPFFVADVKLLESEAKGFTVTVDANSMCLRLPIRTGTTRLIGLVPRHIKNKDKVVFEDVREMAERLAGVKVGEVNWFSPYRVNHRVADKYRRGDVFMAGDACHVHSPMGGQGMNTGIGDAFNLGWKLAAVVNHQASPDVLDTYEPERRAFAVQLVNTTDKAFSVIMSDRWWGSIVRLYIWPWIMSILTRIRFAKLTAFKTVSQIGISYPTSDLSTGSAGSVKAGSRMPYVEYGDGIDNFSEFDGLKWQLHVYGDDAIDLEELSWIPVKRWPFNAKVRKAGIAKDSVFLTRPDTYIGLAMERFDFQKLEHYVSRLKLRP